ncbi:hypothetical protein [Nafulsella turpanensis]|uniref:hypothetical protein n=1 Tax=Nafulsella turpanensis TaxID=1265690 RepID=UPI00037555B5|nr:hypothetical protein [Nafulsella turpanensis]
MAKLYVFGIGGTGSRVLRALTMLMASGVEINSSIDTIVPIIIDPDSANGDMNRTADILTKYQEIKKPFENEKSGFFNVKIKTLSQLTGQSQQNVSDNFKFEINGTHSRKFKDYIGYNSLDNTNKAFLDLLFSQHNLEADMGVGFKGNPNIGSVVLNQFTKSPEFNQFLASFSKDDKIFIVSSIFGGTGASGFPLLLKNLREINAADGKAFLVKDAVIGAVTVLPYFKLKPSEDENSEINSSSFLGKTKAALAYYERTIVADKRLNSFYYIGDHDGGMYDNYDGRDKQKNHAHFVELASALAIVDFIAESPHLSTANGIAESPRYKEFGVESQNGSIAFNSLGTNSFSTISKPLSQFALFSLYLKIGLEKAKNSTTTWLEEKENGVPKKFFSDYYFKNNLSKFIQYFDEWLDEIEHNRPSFKPFNSNVSYNNALEFVEGYKPRKKLGFFNNADIGILDGKANKVYREYSQLSNESKLIRTFYHVTEDVLTENVGL